MISQFSPLALLELAIEVSNELNSSLIDMRFVKPLDEKLISLLAEKHKFSLRWKKT